MSEREKLDFEAIEKWALAHGFVKTSDHLLTAPYGPGSVQIEFLIRDIRVWAVCGDHKQRLITARPGQLHIDENEMLQGAGLFSRFYSRYRDDFREKQDDAIMPVWFSDKVKMMVAEHVSLDQKLDRLR